MAIIQVLDNFSEKLFKYACSQLGSSQLVIADNNLYSLAENYREILDIQNKSHSILNFWIIFSVAFESLVKAILIKHEVNGVFRDAQEFAELKQISEIPNQVTDVEGENINNWSWEEGKLTITKDYFKQGCKVKVNNVGWLQNQFTEHGFEYVKQINTCTLGNTPNLIQNLMRLLYFNEQEIEKTTFAIRHLTKMRRNRDLHCYFGEQTFMETIYGTNDLIDMYIPCINTLIMLYNTEPQS